MTGITHLLGRAPAPARVLLTIALARALVRAARGLAVAAVVVLTGVQAMGTTGARLLGEALTNASRRCAS